MFSMEPRAIVSVGTTGESPTLSHDEHVDVVRATVELAAGRIRVIAGNGSNSTHEAVQLTERIAPLRCRRFFKCHSVLQQAKPARYP